jgi:predicted nuclease of predicted toxin-antitoxin system
VRTLWDVYGNREERVPDEEWLARAGDEGWLVLTKDAQIRRRSTELSAIRQHRAKVFLVTGKRLTGTELAARVVQNLRRVEQAARKRGPFIYAVYEKRIERIWPRAEP